MSSTMKETILVTGGHGFIGSNIARRLFNSKSYIVKATDIVPDASLDGDLCDEFILGDLLDLQFCKLITEGVDVVLHFAANMGGMGTIHDGNEALLYNQNHAMTLNILSSSAHSNVKRFLFASSACVYPESLQKADNIDVSLREEDAWMNPPPQPQGLYGLEKLVSEILLQQQQYASKMDVRIARFHNVYGPGGAWNDGREKAPAAMLRKAAALKALGAEQALPFEIWGDGTQRRSFLFIEDAVDGILKLLRSDYTLPLNIGSDSSVTVRQLADFALGAVGLTPASVTFSFDKNKPLGVASRNSNNDKVKAVLGWEPRIGLEEGMGKTARWIQSQVERSVQEAPEDRVRILEGMMQSKVLDLNKEIVFAILLPVTSRGGGDCLENLKNFAASLKRTTWRDVRDPAGHRFRFVVYLAMDEDDEVLVAGGRSSGRAEKALRTEVVAEIKVSICNYPRGHVCKHWKKIARKAFEDGCDYYVLMGDDVVVQDEGWMRDAHMTFQDISSDSRAPFGFGCVAFTDISFPGMPTFPIVHRNHMEMFGGEVIPDIFVNQDGDPFLFQLYRRWGCSKMFPSRISNGIGGGAEARYAKEHAKDWTFGTLDNAVDTIQSWLNEKNSHLVRHVVLDIVIPCYRVDLPILKTILDLECPPGMNVMFIIIVDDPKSPYIDSLKGHYGHRPDVRIRVNRANLGASASRNRGMEESAADWVHFLDDDVVPDDNLLIETEAVIRANPDAAGFIGNCVFPPADTMFKTAVHLSGVTYFWDIATKMKEDLPWGVTANLIARRVKDGVTFDLMYPKTGGGEDIDFCRRKRNWFAAKGARAGFIAAPSVQITHPWWNNGRRSYWRFYNWSVGDGALVKNFPEHTYVDFAPNSAECLLLCASTGVVATLFAQFGLVLIASKAFVAVAVVNVLFDCYRHLLQHPERHVGMDSNISGLFWLAAAVESSFIRIFSEIGRLRGVLGRGEYSSLGRRFDWHTGRVEDRRRLSSFLYHHN